LLVCHLRAGSLRRRTCHCAVVGHRTRPVGRTDRTRAEFLVTHHRPGLMPRPPWEPPCHHPQNRRPVPSPQNLRSSSRPLSWSSPCSSTSSSWACTNPNCTKPPVSLHAN